MWMRTDTYMRICSLLGAVMQFVLLIFLLPRIGDNWGFGIGCGVPFLWMMFSFHFPWWLDGHRREKLHRNYMTALKANAQPYR
jgi:hypothetical protein